MGRTRLGRGVVSRREWLASVAGITATGVAGCGGRSEATSTTSSGTTRSRPATGSDAGTTTATTGQAAEPRLSIPQRGDPSSTVRVLVFEDFACPHCREFTRNVVPQLESAYIEPGRILYEFHDFPIPVHEEISWEAACAARAVQAAEGDAAFFEYAHALFENQPQLGPATYERLASEQGLDGTAIRESAVNREYITTVRADRSAARELGIRGTPTVVVGRRAVQPTYDAISSAIDDQLSTR